MIREEVMNQQYKKYKKIFKLGIYEMMGGIIYTVPADSDPCRSGMIINNPIHNKQFITELYFLKYRSSNL